MDTNINKTPKFVLHVCQVLRYIGVHHMTPEVLRRGKMNVSDAEVTSRLWKALYSVAILQKMQHSLRKQTKVVSPEVWQLSGTALCRVCKALLQDLGYSRAAFYALSYQTSHSLELFLALVFLMAKTDVFELYWNKRFDEVKASGKLPPYPYDTMQLNSQLSQGKNKAAVRSSRPSSKSRGPADSQCLLDQSRRLLARYGKLKHMLNECQGLEAARLNQVVRLRQMKGGLQGTPFELHLLNSQSALTPHVLVLEKYCQLKRERLDSLELEKTFWKWASSSLSCSKKDLFASQRFFRSVLRQHKNDYQYQLNENEQIMKGENCQPTSTLNCCFLGRQCLGATSKMLHHEQGVNFTVQAPSEADCFLNILSTVTSCKISHHENSGLQKVEAKANKNDFLHNIQHLQTLRDNNIQQLEQMICSMERYLVHRPFIF